MIPLPHAHVSQLFVVQHDKTLVVVARGRASGFDGTLEVVRGSEEIFPPMFHVLERPGNCGITGECPPDREVTVGVAFESVLAECLVRTASGVQHVTVVPVVTSTVPVTRNRLPHPGSNPNPSGEWSAWVDTMPGTRHTLHVVGRVLTPTPGYTVTLTPMNPQGINPRILLLALTVVPPTNVQPQVITEIEARYSEPAEPDTYTHVTIPELALTLPVLTTS